MVDNSKVTHHQHVSRFLIHMVTNDQKGKHSVFQRMKPGLQGSRVFSFHCPCSPHHLVHSSCLPFPKEVNTVTPRPVWDTPMILN